jgi:type II secretion system protein N
MIRTILLALGSLFWMGFTFLVGVYATFPGEAARSWLQYKLADSTKDEYAVEMDPLALWWFPGAKADNVTVYSVKKGRKQKGEDSAPLERTPIASLDSLAARVQLLPRLFGKASYGFSGSLNGGDVDGHYADSDAVTELSFEASDIDLAKSPVDNESATLNLVGKVLSDCDLVVDKEDVKNSTGSLKVEIEGLGLAAGSKVSGFDLPEVNFTKALMTFEVKDGKLEVTEGTFASDVLNATLTGDISLNKKLSRSRYRLELAFTLPEDIDKLAQIAPDMKRSRDKDGAYHMLVSGNLFAPKFRLGKGAAGKKKAGGAVDDGGLLGGDGADEATDEDREERRRRREERIKERRERMKKRREEAGMRGSPDEPPDGEPNPPPGLDDRIEEDPLALPPPGIDEGPRDMPDVGPPPQEGFEPPPDEEQQ